MSSLGRTLIAAGIALVVLGLVLHGLPWLPLGRLPGDIRIERPGVRIYLPITTCLLASLVLSGAFWLFSKWR
jgi:Protein of unknown function (DUF2905)